MARHVAPRPIKLQAASKAARQGLLESRDRNIRKLKLTKCAPILRFAGSAFLRTRVGIDDRLARRARTPATEETALLIR
jgi:hypothetical protein